MIRIALFLIFTICIVSRPSAQDILKSHGKAQMVLEDDISKEELKEELRMQAKIDAIEGSFGSLIEQESRVEIKEGGASFDIVGDRYLKGEWLKTTNEKFTEEYRKVKTGAKGKMELWVSCEIEGLIREMSKSKINLDFTTTNCPDKLCRTTDFLDGESMYLFFKSPVNGFLTVFTVEKEGVFRLLPYQQMPPDFDQYLPIVADKEYLFFSADEDHDFFEGFSPGFADELVMTTEAQEEYLYLYIIFSMSEFAKPNLEASYTSTGNEHIVPRSLSEEEFESWLSENRIRSQDFYFKKLRLKISK